MLLAIDVGNTRTKAASTNNGVWFHRKSAATSELHGSAAWATFLGQFEGLSCVIASSVVTDVEAPMCGACEQLFGRGPIMLSAALPIGIDARYRTQETLGSDRLANAIGAISFGRLPAIVVDVGTATKFEAIDRSGAYLGGAIMPGLEMGASSLASGTSRLPAIPIQGDVSPIGNDTLSSLRSGVVLGHVGAIEGMVKRFSEELGPSEVLLTGGGALLVSPHMGVHYQFVEDLTLIGLREAWHRLLEAKALNQA